MRYDEFAETKEQEMRERNADAAPAPKAQAARHLSMRQKHYVD